MKKYPLSQFNNLEKDLLFWMQQYMLSKLTTNSHKNAIDGISNIVEFSSILLAAKSIEELAVAVRKIAGKHQKLHALNSYHAPLRGLFQFFFDRNIKSFKDIDNILIKKYETDFLQGREPKGFMQYSQNIRAFFKFIHKYSIQGLHEPILSRGKVYPTANITMRTTPYLQLDDFEKFMKVVENYPYQGLKEQYKLMIKLLCFGGLSINEIINLKNDDIPQIDQNAKFYKISFIKDDGTRRTTYIRYELIHDDYQNYLKVNNICIHGYLFCPKNKSTPYKFSSVWDQIKRMMKYAGIDAQKNGEGILRRSYAYYLFSLTGDIKYIATVFFGNSTREVTELFSLFEQNSFQQKNFFLD